MDLIKKYNFELEKIRNLFYKIGKIEDSNAKIDEILKFISIIFYLDTNFQNLKEFKTELESLENNPKKFIDLITKKFELVKKDKLFKLDSNTYLFDENEKIILDTEEIDIVKILIFYLIDVFSDKLNFKEFDLINELFGSFIRDNFRSNIEDAQYLTPIEVVDFITELNLPHLNTQKEILIADPFCGVGSFLLRSNEFINNKNIKFIAQDKIPRMVRFAYLNLLLSGAKKESLNFYIGNSYSGNSGIDKYKGEIDLIVTNPPFGVKLHTKKDIKNIQESYKYFPDDIINREIYSETLSISRCLNLLKPGGRLSIILPDGVVSAQGLNKSFRKIFKENNLVLDSIVSLPAVTFAQAGTRTKTHIVTLINNSSKSFTTKIAIANEIGFSVKSKKGIKVKILDKENELISIGKKLKQKNNNSKIISQSPSVTQVKSSILNQNLDWNPNHYSSKLFKALEDQIKSNKNDYNLVKLDEVVEFITNERKKEKIHPETVFISVLHIINNRSLDFKSMNSFEVKDKGIKCYPGDLIFSKINPRIPRSIVVPDFSKDLSCSNEFEILNSKSEFDNYFIKCLLTQEYVLEQILNMTSGTSASHNRLKTNDFKNIIIPIPKSNSPKYEKLKKLSEEYKYTNKNLLKNELKLNELEESIYSQFN